MQSLTLKALSAIQGPENNICHTLCRQGDGPLCFCIPKKLGSGCLIDHFICEDFNSPSPCLLTALGMQRVPKRPKFNLQLAIVVSLQMAVKYNLFRYLASLYKCNVFINVIYYIWRLYFNNSLSNMTCKAYDGFTINTVKESLCGYKMITHLFRVWFANMSLRMRTQCLCIPLGQ